MKKWEARKEIGGLLREQGIFEPGDSLESAAKEYFMSPEAYINESNDVVFKAGTGEWMTSDTELLWSFIEWVSINKIID